MHVFILCKKEKRKKIIVCVAHNKSTITCVKLSSYTVRDDAVDHYLKLRGNGTSSL